MVFKAKLSHIFCIFGMLLATPRQTAANTCSIRELTRGILNFGIDLHIQLAGNNNYAERSIVFSPFSIDTCLAMIRMGAEGETAAEIDEVAFGLPQQNKELAQNYHSLLEKYEKSTILKVANKMYVNEGYEVNGEFSNLVTNQFYSSVEIVNFSNSVSAADTINTWVKEKTNNLITDLVRPSSLNADTRLVLVNAIHFKGQWAYQFPLNETLEEDFYSDDNQKTKVQMMSIAHKFKYIYLWDLKASAVEIPYKGGDLSMLVILPDIGTSLDIVENGLKFMALDRVISEMYNTTVVLKLPKFKVEFEAQLSQPLSEMGMERMFTENAQFGNMLIPSEGVKVSSIVHKATLEVTEVGTEAAAATEAEMDNRFGDDPVSFIADRPFHYIIKNASNLVLFEGNFKNN